MATPRHYHSCAVYDDHIYVLGGKDVSSTEILNLSSNTWTSGPEMPEVFPSAQAFTYQDAIYPISKEGTVYKLDDDKAGWTEVVAVGNIGNRPVNPALVVNEDILHILPC